MSKNFKSILSPGNPTGWMEAWETEPSPYAFAAEMADDLAAAVKEPVTARQEREVEGRGV